ncbi:MAG: hypothetical protein JJ714_11575 [Acidithiobacillus sp.]|nr:hypothetical protein [Acidithiobacillus sp.]
MNRRTTTGNDFDGGARGDVDAEQQNGQEVTPEDRQSYTFDPDNDGWIRPITCSINDFVALSVNVHPRLFTLIFQDDGRSDDLLDSWHVVKWSAKSPYQPRDYLSLDGKSKIMIQRALHLLDAWRNNKIDNLTPYTNPLYPMLVRLDFGALVKYAQKMHWDLPEFLTTPDNRATNKITGISNILYESRELKMLVFLFQEYMEDVTDESQRPDYDQIEKDLKEKWLAMYEEEPDNAAVKRIMMILKRDIDSQPGRRSRR